ncbi:hypothetical protein [Paenibacillus sp. GYB003]|uniref:hypothetical protein n=1 Tax=Paenibacillus sp. GYB003 TaxID=2994392 RepID=UPI002F96A04E
MIDKAKLRKLIDKYYTDASASAAPFDHGVVWLSLKLLDAIDSGDLNEDPVSVPTLQKGDKVLHKDKRNAYLGVGNVLDIAASGERAYVEWPNYDKRRAGFYPPAPAYYRLDKLIKVGG